VRREGEAEDGNDSSLNLLSCPPGMLFESIATASTDGLIVMGADGTIIAVNLAAEKIFDRRKEELLGQDVQILMPERYHQRHRRSLSRCVRSGFSDQFGRRRVYEGVRSDGAEFPMEISISGVQIEGRWIFFAFIRDISEQRRIEEALAQRSLVDSLTGLFNRGYFDSRMDEQIAWANRKRQPLALIFCDLDHFKEVNERMGHAFGDTVLRLIGQTIRETVRRNDLAFRWGGDEIALILPETNRKEALTVSTRIRSALRASVAQETGVDLDISIGIALCPAHGLQIRELTQVADRALYIAKKGGDKVHIGEEDYPLDDSAVLVVFQPVVDLRSNEVMGFEALSRDPKGNLSIMELFRRYEMVGRAQELKRLCFKLQLRMAQRLGLRRLFVNVNFDMLAELGALPMPPNLEVVLEISERDNLSDVQTALSVALPWRKAGYQFAIDDFGAGFVSLPFMAQFIPNYIKLDRSTVSLAAQSREFSRFLQQLLSSMTDYVSKGLIAEGIETQKEREVVSEIGIHLGQGFLLGRPGSLAEKPDGLGP